MPDLLRKTHWQDVPRPQGQTLASVREARSAGFGIAPAIEDTVLAKLADVTGRVLAQSIKARAPLPRFDYSAMDGYAVDAEFVRSGMILKVTGLAAAGRSDRSVIQKGNNAIRILTGASIPSGANAVVAQEEVTRKGEYIELRRTPASGQHIRMCGEDARTGDTLIQAGTCIGPLEAGVAASIGVRGVRIFRKLRVAIFTNGSELRQPGQSVSPGEIYDSNKSILKALLDKAWIDIIDLGAAQDNLNAVQELLQDAASRADVIISAGGVSVGDEDHMVEAVGGCGGDILINKVAIKPGKPFVLGRIGGASYVGLPGNPGALFTTFLVIVDGLLRARAGISLQRSCECPAVASFEWEGKPGRTVFLPAVVGGYDRVAPLIDVLPDANSGKLHLLSRAQGFAVIGPDIGKVRRCDCIGWFPFK